MKYRILLFLLISPYFLNAQAFRNYSNEFLNIGVDAAALGMSKAVVATTNNVNAIYWNPAGLVGIEDYQGSLMYASYFAGIANYNYAAFAMPIDKNSALGVSVIRFGVDDILNTTELIDSNGNIDFNRISLFSAADYAFNVAYARNLIFKDLKIGVNAKVVRRIIGDFATSWGFGFDLGMQYKIRDTWQFGLMLRDVTNTFNTWQVNQEAFSTISGAVFGQNQEAPETTELTLPKAQLGAARRWEFRSDLSLRAELDLNMRFTQTNDIIATEGFSMTPALGLEFGYLDIVYARLGAGNLQKGVDIFGDTTTEFQPNLGLGFKYKGIKVDYALTDIGDQSTALYSNIFSLTLDWSYFR